METQFRAFYAAFNARDAETLLTAMTPDVDWANGMTGGRVHGRDGVRAYWAAQWATIDSRVEPVQLSRDEAGNVLVDVHQVVRDIAGSVLIDRMVRHVYRLRDGFVARLDILEDVA
jgi:ketosteroid isomerase-like protein